MIIFKSYIKKLKVYFFPLFFNFFCFAINADIKKSSANIKILLTYVLLYINYFLYKLLNYINDEIYLKIESTEMYSAIFLLM